jgi:hypothetical protein
MKELVECSSVSRLSVCAAVLASFVLSGCWVAVTGQPIVDEKGKNMTTQKSQAEQADAALKQAENAVARENWLEANRLLKDGLQAVGDQYVSPNTLDDTGMKLALASAEEKKGNLETAAHLRLGVLKVRLSMLRQKTAS